MFKSYGSICSRDNLSCQILSAAVLSKHKIIRVLSLGPVKILQVQRVISLPALTSGIDHGLLVPGKLPGERTVGGKIPKKLWDAGERQPGLLAKSGPPRTHGRPAKNSEARNTCQASDPERGDRRSRKKILHARRPGGGFQRASGTMAAPHSQGLTAHGSKPCSRANRHSPKTWVSLLSRRGRGRGPGRSDRPERWLVFIVGTWETIPPEGLSGNEAASCLQASEGRVVSPCSNDTKGEICPRRHLAKSLRAAQDRATGPTDGSFSSSGHGERFHRRDCPGTKRLPVCSSLMALFTVFYGIKIGSSSLFVTSFAQKGRTWDWSRRFAHPPPHLC